MNNRSNSSMYSLIGLSVLLSLSAIIAVAAHWPDRGLAVAPAAPARHAVKLHTVSVVMHDPGCHWFQTHSGLKTKLAVGGPVKLTNMDEAAIKIVGPSGTKVEPVGGNVRLGPGQYRITMVGQASDDNHLKLAVI